MRHTQFLFLSILIICSSCDPEEIANSKDVNPDTIFSSYTLEYKEGNQEVECTAKFRFGGPEGTTLVLNDSSEVRLDNELLSVDSGKYSGAFYMISKPFAGFVGNNAWTYMDVKGKLYKETFSFKSIGLSKPITATIDRSALDLKFDGLANGDSIYITVADTSSRTISDDKKYFVQNDVVQIPAAIIKELKPGIIELNFHVEDIISLKNSTKEGGQFTQTYTLKKAVTKLEK